VAFRAVSKNMKFSSNSEPQKGAVASFDLHCSAVSVTPAYIPSFPASSSLVLTTLSIQQRHTSPFYCLALKCAEPQMILVFVFHLTFYPCHSQGTQPSQRTGFRRVQVPALGNTHLPAAESSLQCQTPYFGSLFSQQFDFHQQCSKLNQSIATVKS
jgi:hypothetical protein